MNNKPSLQRPGQEIVFLSARDLLDNGGKFPEPPALSGSRAWPGSNAVSKGATARQDYAKPAIADLRLPFSLKADQVAAADEWMANGCRGSIIYGSGTGKTEIALECARRLAEKRAKHEGSQRLNVLLLVPRIVLVQQNIDRLVRYGINEKRLARFFGEEKQVSEITIATYHSTLANPALVRRADMVIFDEVHLATGAFTRLLANAAEDQGRALLGLTATIDQLDPRYSSILRLIPPVRKYLIRDAVADKRLARPVVVPVKVRLTKKEQRLYDRYSANIRNISRRFRRYDARQMMELMKEDGFPRWQARAWFLNVKKRKRLLASSDDKLRVAADLIAERHPESRIMVFSETLESVRSLRQILKSRGISSALIDSKIPSFRRQKILSEWGKKYHALLSVHTLEIGYDVPEAGIEIILATTSNMNQIVQRIGRVLRKVDGKDSATIYLVYVSDTKDDGILASVRNAIETSGGSEIAK